MNSPATLLRPRRGILPAAPPLTSERLIRRRVYLSWGLLFLNALTFYPGYSFIHIPSIIGKGIAQAALPVALLCALSLNRRVMVRPNVFLCLVTLIVLEASCQPCSRSTSGPSSGPSGSPDSWSASGC